MFKEDLIMDHSVKHLRRYKISRRWTSYTLLKQMLERIEALEANNNLT